ncbi:MAG: hypothetical protein ABI700_28590 [Chloroflexota bacterium]
MGAKNFKVGDRVTLPKVNRSGKVIAINVKQLPNAPETGVKMYSIRVDGLPELLSEVYEGGIEHEQN